jgi:hypothetical protein
VMLKIRGISNAENLLKCVNRFGHCLTGWPLTRPGGFSPGRWPTVWLGYFLSLPSLLRQTPTAATPLFFWLSAPRLLLLAAPSALLHAVLLLGFSAALLCGNVQQSQVSPDFMVVMGRYSAV